MNSLSTILNILQQIKPELQEKYHVRSIGVFGSAARDDFRPDSDIDLLVDFTQPVGVAFIDLAEYLEKKMSAKVDLVSKNGIKPAYLPIIEKDLVYV